MTLIGYLAPLCRVGKPVLTAQRLTGPLVDALRTADGVQRVVLLATVTMSIDSLLISMTNPTKEQVDGRKSGANQSKPATS